MGLADAVRVRVRVRARGRGKDRVRDRIRDRTNNRVQDRVITRVRARARVRARVTSDLHEVALQQHPIGPVVEGGYKRRRLRPLSGGRVAGGRGRAWDDISV